MKQKLGLVFLHYIRLLAKLQLAKLNLFRKVLGKKGIKIVGITGSAGKTSTMLAVVAALEPSFRVKYSKKANSESGIPLNILGLRMKDFSLRDWFRVAGLSLVKLLTNWGVYDVYVVEMGIDEPEAPKNMEYLLRIVRPDVGVFISVTPVHAMQFEKALPESAPEVGKKTSEVLGLIADEKAKLISALPENGYAVLNFDDPLVKERKKLTLAEVIGVGRDVDSRIRLTDYQVNLKGTEFKYQADGRKIKLRTKGFVLPLAYGINFGLALGVVQALDGDLNDAVQGISENLVLPSGRSSLIEGIKGTFIIDSSYNASPAAMETMLDLLARLGKKTKSKKIAVLGDMRELGGQSKVEHERLAEKAVDAAGEIVTVGPLMKKYFQPKLATISDVRRIKLTSFDSAREAAEYLKENITGKELILVKGSQNTIFLEIVVEALMADPSRADDLLCRRGEYWEVQRRELT